MAPGLVGLFTTAGWVILAFIAAVIGVGIVLSLESWSDPEDRGALGRTLLTSGVISLAFFLLQNENEKNRRKVANGQALRVTIGLARDLRGADLKEADLTDVDLARKNLDDSDLRNAILSDVNLRNAMLNRSKLDEGHLQGADLTEAELRKALLNGIDLRRATLDRAHLEGAAIGRGPKGEGANLAGASLIDAHLRGACLAFADLRGAVLGGADLTDAVLTGADLRGAILEQDGIRVNLAGASLAQVKVDPDGRPFLPQSATVPASTGGGAPAEAIHDRVTGVSDGDTVKLAGLGWVRLIGIDAPDLKDSVGAEARDFLETEKGWQPAIRYKLGHVLREFRPGNRGRWRAYVWLADGRFLNQSILEGGYAERQTDQPEDPGYVQLLNQAEQRAKAAGRRIWATCRKE